MHMIFLCIEMDEMIYYTNFGEQFVITTHHFGSNFRRSLISLLNTVKIQKSILVYQIVYKIYYFLHFQSFNFIFKKEKNKTKS